MPNTDSEKSAVPSLAATQQLLHVLITSPDDVATQLQRHPAWAALFTPSRSLSSAQRVQIYANMYRWRLHDVLAEDFPAVRAYVGEARFPALIWAYLRAYPPSSHSLRHAGQSLASFLSQSAWHHEYPFLPEVARFEWALLEIFDAADAVPLTQHALRQMPASTWPTLPLRLIPAQTVLTLQWRIDQIHENAPALPSHQPAELLIWRKADAVLYRPLESLEAILLGRLTTTAVFADLCDVALRHLADGEAAVVSRYLSRWVEAQLLTTLDTVRTT